MLEFFPVMFLLKVLVGKNQKTGVKLVSWGYLSIFGTAKNKPIFNSVTEGPRIFNSVTEGPRISDSVTNGPRIFNSVTQIKEDTTGSCKKYR